MSKHVPFKYQLLGELAIFLGIGGLIALVFAVFATGDTTQRILIGVAGITALLVTLKLIILTIKIYDKYS